MSKVWKAAVFILLVVAGIVLILKLKPPVGSPSPVASPLAAATRHQPVQVDLATFYDQDSSFDAPGCWQAVPRGEQTLANVPFKIAGLIQLWGQGPAGMGRIYRESVEGIPAKGNFETLYVLHGASFATAKETPIAEVVFRYTDGSSATNQILYWTDSRDWWQPQAETDPLPTNSASKVVWRGDHPSLPDWVKSLRLFGLGIPNPKPKSEVKGVDLISTKSSTAWVVLAVTTGPAGLLKADTQLEQDEDVSIEETSMVLTVLDKDTGRPVPDMRFQVTLFNGRRTKPYGFFDTDERGEFMVDLPAGPIKRLSIQAAAGDYQPAEMSWDMDKKEKIPTNYVFKVSKRAP